MIGREGCRDGIDDNSEPPKRVVSGWVVSWDPSFALHIKKRFDLLIVSIARVFWDDGPA